ncbi:MAG: AhpC/TSA family protein [Bacteroidales bacterium]|nr:AhpC/TSA family protein [Bacteroidales bacterium]
MKFFTSLLFVFMFSISITYAQQPSDAYLHKFGIDTKNVPTGLKVGDKAPNFISPDQYGKSIELSKLLKKGPVVLIFYRGYWCPLCNQHLAKFQDSLQYVTQQGAQVVAVSAQTYGNSEKMIHKQNITFYVISDTTDQIMKDYHVMFHVTPAYQALIEKYLKLKINTINGQESAELPVPATFVIDKNGTIVYRQFNYDYGKRSTVKEVLEHLPKN